MGGSSTEVIKVGNGHTFTDFPARPNDPGSDKVQWACFSVLEFHFQSSRLQSSGPGAEKGAQWRIIAGTMVMKVTSPTNFAIHVLDQVIKVSRLGCTEVTRPPCRPAGQAADSLRIRMT